MDRRVRSYLLVSPFIFWFLFFILGPLGVLAVTSFTARDSYGVLLYGNWSLEAFKSLLDPLYLKVMAKTALFAFVNTVLCVSLAFPVAFWLSRLSPQKRSWGMTALLLPFWTSFLIRILAFMDLLRLDFFGVPLLYTSTGIQGAMVYNYLPFALMPLYSTMEKIENSWLEAAKDLGASPWQILTQLLIPLCKSGIITASLFVFIPSLGEFLIPDLVGGGRKFFLGTFLQNQFLSARNWPLGSAAILLLVGITLLGLGIMSLNIKEENAGKVE